MLIKIILVLCFVYPLQSTENDCSERVLQYEEYLKIHKKSSDRLQDPSRLQKFCDTMAFVESHSADSYSIALNEKADWLDGEIQQLFHSQSLLQQDGPKVTEVETYSDSDEPESMNWASYNNKYGYPVVPLVQDQGLCGACWAFVSASAVHSSVKLELAKEKSSPEPVVPTLSPQQLIDCDRSMNNGCNGGSPFYAFQYVELNGLVSSSEYPFKEKQFECHSIPTKDNRYYIQSYQFLPPSNENLLLRSLLSGPVSIGICGSDATFLYYSRGIYSQDYCCTDQNHAMLLVGYGTDRETGVDYWIAQNSWGLDWGEQGYMRLKRNTDTPAAYGEGMCGLALSPIQAFGGRVEGNETVVDFEDSVFERFVMMPLTEGSMWVQDNWKSIGLGLAISSLLLGIFLFLSEYCLADWGRMCCPRTARGYTAIPDVVGAGVEGERTEEGAVDGEVEYSKYDDRRPSARRNFEIESSDKDLTV